MDWHFPGQTAIIIQKFCDLRHHQLPPMQQLLVMSIPTQQIIRWLNWEEEWQQKFTYSRSRNQMKKVVLRAAQPRQGVMLHFYFTLLSLPFSSPRLLNILTLRRHGRTRSTIMTHSYLYLWLTHFLSMTHLLLLDLTHTSLTQHLGILLRFFPFLYLIHILLTYAHLPLLTCFILCCLSSSYMFICSFTLLPFIFDTCFTYVLPSTPWYLTSPFMQPRLITYINYCSGRVVL